MSRVMEKTTPGTQKLGHNTMNPMGSGIANNNNQINGYKLSNNMVINQNIP